APGLAVTIDLIGSPNRTDAEAKARTLAAGGPAADALFNDTRTARKGVEVAAATDTQNAGSVVFGTPVGEVVAYQPDPQQATWNVFRVTDRRTDARAPGPAAALSLQQLYLIGQRTLQPIADPVAGAELLDAVAVMDRLRSPGGCPWDAEQTHTSLLQYLVEECYELYDAVEKGDRAAMREELGDVLLQVLFHARIAAEDPDGFTIDDVARDLVAKLV